MRAMGLKSFFEIFDFLEFNGYGEYSVNWKKLIKASIIIFLFVTFLATFIMVAKGNIFPTEMVYVNVWHSNDTDYHIGINASTDYFANNFIKGVYLSSSELNYNNTKIELNSNHNLDYTVKVPRNVKHFVLRLYFEPYFPIPPKYITLDVTRV